MIHDKSFFNPAVATIIYLNTIIQCNNTDIKEGIVLWMFQINS